MRRSRDDPNSSYQDPGAVRREGATILRRPQVELHSNKLCSRKITVSAMHPEISPDLVFFGDRSSIQERLFAASQSSGHGIICHLHFRQHSTAHNRIARPRPMRCWMRRGACDGGEKIAANEKKEWAEECAHFSRTRILFDATLR